MKPASTIAVMLAMLVLPVFSQDAQPPTDDDIAELGQKAEQGDAEAQAKLGAMYDDGLGVPADDEEAVRWYRAAADQGNADGQKHVGAMYVSGQGVPQDDQEAARWFLLAAEQGDADAQVLLGTLYRHGEGVSQNYIQASGTTSLPHVPRVSSETWPSRGETLSPTR